MAFLVCCVFAYWLVKHMPGLVGEAAQELFAARRGEESPAAVARRQRLLDAGYDPAGGGAFGRYAGNVWRDFWRDLDRQRRDRRESRPEPDQSGGAGWWERFRRRFDEAVDHQADQWRRRHNPDPEGDQQPTPGGAEPPPAEPAAAPEPTGPPLDGNPQPAGPSPESPIDPEPAATPNHDNTPPGPEWWPTDPAVDQPPIRVDATVGTPEPATRSTGTAVLELEGTPTMANDLDTRGAAVTGVVSGAAEARSIQRALEAATDAYDAAVVAARRRIHSLGEQTVGVVQMAGKSTVVEATAQAAEAIAAAQAGVNTCRAEVIPLLGRVAREFDRRNS